MKVLVCTDNFKETLDSPDVCAAIARGLPPTDTVVTIPLSDGGDGFLLAFQNAMKGEMDIVSVTVNGPKGTPRVEARYGIAHTNAFAVIEMAEAVGLPLVPTTERNPMVCSTYGVGEMIMDAFHRGVRHIILGIGGSSTMDAGLGALQPMGLKIRCGGEWLRGPFTAGHMLSLEDLDFDTSVCEGLVIDLACDVTNPFTGPNGSARVYGPQKGATPEMIDQLDEAAVRLGQLLEAKFGRWILDVPGTGAAGGFSGSFHAVLGSKLKPGNKLFLDFVRLEDAVRWCDVVITGEGSYDAQSAMGKTISGVTELCVAHNKKMVVVCGRSLLDKKKNVIPIVAYYPLQQCLTQTARFVEEAVRRSYASHIALPQKPNQWHSGLKTLPNEAKRPMTARGEVGPIVQLRRASPERRAGGDWLTQNMKTLPRKTRLSLKVLQ